MSLYAVHSPMYEAAVGPSAYLPEGAYSETTCEYWEGEAQSSQQAKVLAVRQWREENRQNWRAHQWLSDRESDGKCPYAGLKAEKI